jgi:hypothetical protein
MMKGNLMAAVHPVTQIELNTIEVERVSLDYQEAVTAHLMRLEGKKFSQIAHQLGTNPARLGEVFRGEKYPDALAAAEKIRKACDPRNA